MNSYEEPGGFKICLIIYGEVESVDIEDGVGVLPRDVSPSFL
jgi:hypothetical protein